ncbi:maestro heat-like repeat-containing protein family member 1 [Melopsittacus undulatus]|uniref:maestro heat-like repeat-containing protein family member 1 n=1 Tax=Melopsittacus undulatus TaxID=13146 RepID=UPI00146E584A|nr:maestro heat-like repeat-containing protein family member 1 [Melopsittacus undulatus]
MLCPNDSSVIPSCLGMTSPKDGLQHPQCGGETEAGKPSWLSACSARSIVKAFEEYLQPAAKMVIVLKTIEAMRDSHICDREELISIVDLITMERASWLTEVSAVVSCIYYNLEHIYTPAAWHSLGMLLLKMAELWPADVTLRLVDLAPSCDSIAVTMWEVLFSDPLILENVLRQLNTRFQHVSVRWRFSSQKVEACIQLLALLASSHVTPRMFAGVYRLREPLVPPRLLSLLLQGLITLSQSPDMAEKILIMLPDLMKTLQSTYRDKMRALVVFRNVTDHLKKKASSIVLDLAEMLVPLFDDECSHIQELSICLFKDIIQLVDWKDKRKMQKKVQTSLVPLMLHMSDEIESVAQASKEALSAAAKVLKWNWLSHHLQTSERWRTMECLLEQEPSRAEEYTRQSLLYLQHSQVSVRLAALRFIALHPLGREKEPQVSSLAWQTLHIVNCLRRQQRQGWIQRVLCCWL